VGWYKEPQDGSPKAIHYTEGGPWFENYRHCEYHQNWKDSKIDNYPSNKIKMTDGREVSGHISIIDISRI
jgi:hypothetical protein